MKCDILHSNYNICETDNLQKCFNTSIAWKFNLNHVKYPM